MKHETNKNAIEIAGARDDNKNNNKDECNVVEVYNLNKNDSSKTNIPVKSECSNIEDHYNQYGIKEEELYSDYNIECSIIGISFLILMFSLYFEHMI